MTGPGGAAQPAAVERHTIDHVPDSERHGRTRDLFTMWFGTNIAPLPLVTGAMGVQVFHQSLWSGVLAVLVGQLLGGVFMALHSAQGPQLGVPQMIQSRAQFGSLGALLIVVVAAAMYVGFFASNIVLAGKSLHGLVARGAGRRRHPARRRRLRGDLPDRLPPDPRPEQGGDGGPWPRHRRRRGGRRRPGPAGGLLHPRRLHLRRLARDGLAQRPVATGIRPVRLRLLALPAAHGPHLAHLLGHLLGIVPGLHAAVPGRHRRRAGQPGPGHRRGIRRRGRVLRAGPAAPVPLQRDQPQCAQPLRRGAVDDHHRADLPGALAAEADGPRSGVGAGPGRSAGLRARPVHRLRGPLRQSGTGAARRPGAVDRDQPHRLLSAAPRPVRLRRPVRSGRGPLRALQRRRARQLRPRYRRPDPVPGHRSLHRPDRRPPRRRRSVLARRADRDRAAVLPLGTLARDREHGGGRGRRGRRLRGPGSVQQAPGPGEALRPLSIEDIPG